MRREDSIEDRVPPVFRVRRQHKHVLDDVEGEAVVRQGAQQLGLEEGGPLLLQDPLASFVTLQKMNGIRSETSSSTR